MGLAVCYNVKVDAKENYELSLIKYISVANVGLLLSWWQLIQTKGCQHVL